jgi:hypothetical protein
MIRALWCWLNGGHGYQWVRNVYGDEINIRGGKRSLWRCWWCGWLQFRGLLHKEPKVIIRTHFRAAEHGARSKMPGRYKPWPSWETKKLQRELARKK